MKQPPQGSSLSRSVSGFANCLAGICVFLLTPFAIAHIRPLMVDYLLGSFPFDWVQWLSWGFIALISLCAYYGLSSLFQVIVQLTFYRKVRNHMSQSGM